MTNSPDFPTATGATPAGGGDAFVAMFSHWGELVYSTYLGGSTFQDNGTGGQSYVAEQGWDIAMDPMGNAYATGITGSDDFPTTTGAFDTNCGDDSVDNDCSDSLRSDAFVVKFRKVESDDTPDTVHIAGLAIAATKTSKTAWAATVTLQAHDWTAAPLVNATINGDWAGDAGYVKTDVVCMTDSIGRCTVESGNIPKRNDSVTFTVTDLVQAVLEYRGRWNHDPDGDSNGTSIMGLSPENGGGGGGGGGGKPCNPRKEVCP